MTASDLKDFTTLQACAAQAGMTCVRTAAGNIVLSRLGGAWIFDDVQKASAWLADGTASRPAPPAPMRRPRQPRASAASGRSAHQMDDLP